MSLISPPLEAWGVPVIEMGETGLNAAVASDAVTITAITAGAEEAAAATAGAMAAAEIGEAAAAGSAMTCGEAVLAAMGPIGAALGIAGVIAWPMAHSEAVKVDIENASDHEWTQFGGTYPHHGKETAYPQERKIKVATKDMTDHDKLFHSMYSFQKNTAAFFGTEGALILKNGNVYITIAWYIPQNGSNGCAVSFDHKDPKAAWGKLIDDGSPGRTSTAKKNGFKVSAALSSTSGGDIAMAVQIENY